MEIFGDKSVSESESHQYGYLSEELVTEILEHLPVKSLLRFRCVSKAWCSQFKHSTFIKNHHLKQERTSKMLLLGRQQFLPPPNPSNSDQYVLSFHDLDFAALEVRSSVPLSSLKEVEGGNPYPASADRLATFSGPIKGIICMSYENHPYILCNPALRQFKLLPPIPVDSPEKDYCPLIQADGFGVSSSSSTSSDYEDQEFKIIVIHKFYHRQRNVHFSHLYTHLYNSRTNSWSKLANAPVYPAMRHPGDVIFFNGACHWSGTVFSPVCYRTILSFDMTSEVFRLMELPDWLPGASISIDFPRPVVLNNCLGVVQCREWSSHSDPVEIWVMQTYGVKKSWTKQFVVFAQPFTTSFLPWKDNNMFMLKRIKVTKQGTCRTMNVDESELKDQLTSLHFRRTRVRKFQVFGAHCTSCGLLYEESLVSLN